MACLLHAGADDHDDQEDLPRRFGAYNLERLLGRGGAGLVFAARQDELERTVAVKVLAAGMFAGREGRERFRAEAQAVAQMDHPGIVPVLEAGECDGLSFFSMPLLAGGSLAEALRNGLHFTGDEAAAFLAGLARAVHYAHQRGVLHRDIKPGNILLTESGEPRLTDFGLSRLIEKESTLTRTNALLGTPAYMAPEQAQNGTVTTAADVYGLGAVLYELLAGQPPFAGGTSVETIRLLLDTEPRRPSVLNAAVDRDLETICLKCLEKDPGKRYGSAEAFADDLQRFRRGEPVLARSAGSLERAWKWARRHPGLAAAVSIAAVAVVSAAVIATVFSLRLENARAATAALSEQRRSEVARLHAHECMAQLEKHDALRAFTAAVDSLAMEEAATGGAARELAVRRARERVAAVQRVCPRVLHAWSHTGAARDGIFSPDGSLALVRTEDDLLFYDTATGLLRAGPVGTGTSDRGWVNESLFFDKAGRYLAVCGVQDAYQRNVRLMDVATRRWLWERAVPMSGMPSFHPDGTRLLLASVEGARWHDAATGAPGPTLHTGQCLAVSVSPDGQLAAVCDAAANLFIYDTVTGAQLHGPLRATQEETKYPCLRWSPDSKWLALIAVGSRSAEGALWQFPGAVPTPPLEGNGAIRMAHFSPDSARVLTEGFQVSRIRVPSGQKLPGNVLSHPGLLMQTAWSPDGNLIAAASTHGLALFWDASSDTETLARLHHDSLVNSVAWSPDGSRILTTGNDGMLKLWALPARDVSIVKYNVGTAIADLEWTTSGEQLTGRTSVSRFVLDPASGTCTDTPTAPAPELPPRAVLSNDGSLYATTASPSGEFELRDARTHAVRHRLQHPGNPVFTVMGFTFSPDGRRLLSYGGNQNTDPTTAEMWDVETGRPHGFALSHSDDILCADFSPDGTLIATGGVDAIPRLWRTADGSAAGSLPRHEYWIWALRFSPDSTRLASASADHTARVWDIQNLTALAPPLQHERIVNRLAWHPDGNRLASADVRGLLRVWDVAPAPEPLPILQQRSEQRPQAFPGN